MTPSQPTTSDLVPAPIEFTGDPAVDTALRDLIDIDRDVRQAAALELGTLAVSATAPALVAQLWSERDFFVRDTISWAAARVADAAVPLLLDALDSTDPASRVQSLHVLSKIADPSTLDAILPLADDSNSDVAAKARWALTRIGDPRTIPILTRHLGTGDDSRWNSLTRELATFGEAAVPALTAALSDAAPTVRRHAAEVLCFVGPSAEAAMNALATALDDADADVRTSAAMALFDLDTPSTRAILARQVESRDPRLRAIAKRVRTDA